MKTGQAAIGVAVLQLLGCQTTPPSSWTVVLDDQDPNLTITRDSGFKGRGCSIDVDVDGVTRVSLRAGQRASLHLDDGAHVVSIHAKHERPTFCADMNDSISMTPSAAHSFQLRIFTPSHGAPRLLPVAAATSGQH